MLPTHRADHLIQQPAILAPCGWRVVSREQRLEPQLCRAVLLSVEYVTTTGAGVHDVLL